MGRGRQGSHLCTPSSASSALYSELQQKVPAGGNPISFHYIKRLRSNPFVLENKTQVQVRSATEHVGRREEMGTQVA